MKVQVNTMVNTIQLIYLNAIFHFHTFCTSTNIPRTNLCSLLSISPKINTLLIQLFDKLFP